MKQELKDKWVKALRSGRYTQGQGVLSAIKIDGSERNCCLGVLCRVARLSKIRNGNSRPVTCSFKINERLSCSGTLPVELLRRFGLSEDAQSFLINMNDQHPATSFPEIADWIEKNVPVTN